MRLTSQLPVASPASLNAGFSPVGGHGQESGGLRLLLRAVRLLPFSVHGPHQLVNTNEKGFSASGTGGETEAYKCSQWHTGSQGWDSCSLSHLSEQESQVLPWFPSEYTFIPATEAGTTAKTAPLPPCSRGSGLLAPCDCSSEYPYMGQSPRESAWYNN